MQLLHHFAFSLGHRNECYLSGEGRADDLVQMVTYTQIATTSFVTTPEGSGLAASGSHEYRVWAALPVKGQGEPVGAVELKVGTWFCPLVFDHVQLSLALSFGLIRMQRLVGDEAAKVGQGGAFRKKWIAKEGNGFVRAVS